MGIQADQAGATSSSRTAQPHASTSVGTRQVNTCHHECSLDRLGPLAEERAVAAVADRAACCTVNRQDYVDASDTEQAVVLDELGLGDAAMEAIVQGGTHGDAVGGSTGDSSSQSGGDNGTYVCAGGGLGRFKLGTWVQYAWLDSLCPALRQRLAPVVHQPPSMCRGRGDFPRRNKAPPAAAGAWEPSSLPARSPADSS